MADFVVVIFLRRAMCPEPQQRAATDDQLPKEYPLGLVVLHLFDVGARQG